MAKCKWCSRSGFFLSVNANGVCNNCSTIISLDVNQKLRIVKESLDIIQKSKNIDTVISRYDLAMENIESLIQYENKGISVTSTPPSKNLSLLKKDREAIIIEKIKEEYRNVLSKVEVATTSKAKITQLSKFLLRVREIKVKLGASSALDSLETELSNLINQGQLNEYLDEAKKAEFKGNKKKALDSYYEALYFIRNDNINDKAQRRIIDEIEGKIRELNGNKAIDL